MQGSSSLLLLILAITSSQGFNIVKRQVPPADDTPCTCVPYYQCSANGTVNEYGAGIIDIRAGADKRCDHYLDVCCGFPDGVDPNPLTSTTPNPWNQGTGNQGTGNQGTGNQGTGNQGTGNQGTGNQGTGNENVGTKGSAGWVIVNNTLVNRPRLGCGYRNPEGVGFKIVGNLNNEAQHGEFPWMVAVLKEETIKSVATKVYQCGGSLIHQRVVLTAAHCVRGLDASKITIRAGEWDTQTRNEPLPHQDRQVAIVAIHPQFNSDTLFNDFAVLILVQPVDFAANVDTVCLPEPGENYDGSRCIANGWGKDQFGDKGKYQVILKSIELPVIPNPKCQESLRTTILGRYFKLHQSFMCAGGERNVDTCQGDGGSPLVCPLKTNPKRYTQVGIVAWGINCGQNGIPGVYANLPTSTGRSWIDQQLRKYNIDPISYRP